MTRKSSLNAVDIEAQIADTINANKTYFIIMGAFILIGWVFVFLNLHYMQHPFWHAVICFFVTLGYLAAVYLFVVKSATSDTFKLLPMFAVATFIFFVCLYGIGEVSKNNRHQCIPKTPLSTTSGYIPDPKAYIDFHANCPDNNYLYDQPAQDYIQDNHKLPSFLMQQNGFTPDPVAWWGYYSTSPHNPYHLDQHVKDTLYQTHYLPQNILHP